MRVAMLSSFRESCGIATYTEDLVDALASSGVESVVLAPLLRGQQQGFGEQPLRLWNRNRAMGIEALRIMRHLLAARPDVVHAQVNLGLFSSRVLLNLAWMCRLLGLPVIATLHGRRGGSLGRNFKVWRIEAALRRADIIVHNDAHRAELPRDRVHVIPHGIDPMEPRDMLAARRRLGLSPTQRIIAHFGFLVPDKGIDGLIRAVAQLRDHGLDDVLLWVSGAAPDDRASQRYVQWLRVLAQELGVASQVRMSGAFVRSHELLTELQAADWIVLNYRTGSSQGSSGALRRALTSGTPVAVSKAAVFDDARSAVRTVYEPLARALAELLSQPELARDTVARAVRYCDDNAWSRIAERHAALYQQVIGRQRSRI